MQFMLVIWLNLLLTIQAAPCEDSATCSVDAPSASTGSQLLQLKHTDSRQPESQVQEKATVREKASVECNLAIGRSMPLNTEGFEEVVASCCFDDMKDFIRRVVGKEGLKVCDEGGLNGFSPFFSCTENAKYLEMKKQLRNGLDGRCPWLAEAGVECRPPAEDCGVKLNPDSRETLLKGYMGIEAENNPPALVTNGKIKDKLRETISEDLHVPKDAVKVAIGTGPIQQKFAASLMSAKTGKYVQSGTDGYLKVNGSLTTFDVSFDPLNGGFTMKNIGEKDKYLTTGEGGSNLLEWQNESDSTFYFQNKEGEYLVEGQDGFVTFSNAKADRLQAQFHGFGLLEGNEALNTSLLESLRRSCTVFLTYEVQQTNPPTLNEVKVKEQLDTLDPVELQTNISKDLSEIEPCLGKLGISTFKYCQLHGRCKNKSIKNAHTDYQHNHEAHDVKTVED